MYGIVPPNELGTQKGVLQRIFDVDISLKLVGIMTKY